MARKKKGGLTELGGRLLAAGGLFTLLPMFGGSSPVFAGLRQLMPMGLLFLCAGAGLLFLGRGRPSVQGGGGPDKPRDRARRRPPLNVVPPTAVATEPPAPPTIVSDVATRAEVSPPPSPKTLTAWGPEVFQAIEWRRFEAVVEALFAQAGMETKSQSHGADGGVDIWLYSRTLPGQPVSVVQCKHWNGRRVGVDKIRELRGVMAAKNVRRGQFATTSTFTPDAEAFAKENGINLLDSDGLLALIAKRTPEQQKQLLDVATEGEFWRPTCVNCGIKLVERKGKDEQLFWGCANYPRCKTTMRRANRRSDT